MCSQSREIVDMYFHLHKNIFCAANFKISFSSVQFEMCGLDPIKKNWMNIVTYGQELLSKTNISLQSII